MAWHISNTLFEKWRSSQVPEAASLEASSLDGNASAPSNGNHTPLLYLQPDRTKAFSRLSRYGMTFKPLTGSLGEDVLTWYREGFLARTSAPLEKEQASKVNAPACGSTWRGSLAKYDPATCSWRTAQYSLLGDLELFSGTWPRWGTMRNGECSERSMPGHLTEESAYGFSLPTPTVMDATLTAKGKAGANGMHSVQLSHLANSGTLVDKNPIASQDKLRAEGKLSMAERMYPTPSTKGLDGGSNSRKAAKNREAFEATGKLNPTWVEWLMGWPLGWTDCLPSETVKSHRSWPWLSESFTNG